MNPKDIEDKYKGRLLQKFGDNYIFTNFEKEGNGAFSVDVFCKIHNTHHRSRISNLLLKYKYCCPTCKKEARAENDKKRGLKIIQERLVDKFGTNITLDQSTFVSTQKEAKFKCEKHGEFLAKPANVVASKNGCFECTRGYKPNGSNGLKYTTESYINACKEVHGHKYDYSKTEYRGCAHKVTIICPTHGEFKTDANVHLKGHHCNKCANISFGLKTRKWSTDYFIQKATETHGGKYDYSNTICGRCDDVVKIGCREHGMFSQIAYNHVLGKEGCKDCLERDVLEPYFKKHDDSHIYLMRVNGNGEDFLKIGISINPAHRKHEIAHDVENQYKVEIIKQVQDYSRRVWLFEKRIHESPLFKKYIPKLSFGGMTECYDLSELDSFIGYFNKFESKVGYGKENTEFWSRFDRR
jgi:hypothetical protein